MNLDKSWFTEACEETGTAFSLKIKTKLADEQTPYQRIEVYGTTNFGNLMVIDGFVMLSSRDNFLYHEMMAHPVLYTHPDPRNILIIGGGDCGTLREVLRHDEIESVTQVEIDERVTRLSEQYFPELCESNNDSRASLVFGDGIQWVKNAETESLDVIIIDSTDPIGPAEGLFSGDFYQDCFKALRPGGLVVQQSESPLLHMKILKDMYSAMRGAGYLDVKSLQFPQPVYPSGWWSATMARKSEMISGFREQDVANKPFKTKYFSVEMQKAALVMPPFFLDAVNES